MAGETPALQPESLETGPERAEVRSLRELIERVSRMGFQPMEGDEDAGLAEVLPFPFLALVGQREMKLALALALINPAIGGVLLIGPRGTGKTTAVRSLADLLPDVPRSLCYYGCMPEDIESGGIDAVCPACAKKYGAGEPLAVMDRVRLIELPLNAGIDEVIGGVEERSVLAERTGIRRGILAQADRNLLYVDEVNLLSDEIVDAILDAAAQGHFSVRRGPVSATYSSRLVLVGSMNPEEGHLRPQILDRFGLRLFIRGLEDPDERLEVYRRVQAYLENPRKAVAFYAPETETLRVEIQNARDLLPDVELPEAVARQGIQLIDRLKIDSLRAEITLFESARAHAAAAGRTQVAPDDIRAVAPMALRLRRSKFMDRFFADQVTEEAELVTAVDETLI